MIAPTAALALFLGGAPVQNPAAPAAPAAGKPVCEQKPVIAQAALPDPRAYLRSLEVFTSQGMTVHVAGSKDRAQKYGFFLAFSVDGDAQPVWVKAGLGKKRFSLRGRPYSVETHLSLLHHERIRLQVRNESTGAVVSDFTTGELAERVQSAGAPMTLLGREYRVTYVEDIQEADGRAQMLSDRHTVLLTTYDAYTYDGGKTGYKFSQIPLQAEQLTGQAVLPRPMNAKANGPRGEVPVVYGFHLSAGALLVYDLTDYLKDGVPACSPLD